MAWRDISHVVECYGTDVSSNNDLEMDITLPGYQVTGISFTRTIHRPIEGIDVLLGQMREDEEMFDFFAHLPVHAMTNRASLRHCIAEYPPTENRRIIPHQFDALDWNWNDTATVLSNYVDDTHFNNFIPFIVEGNEAFGTIQLLREDNRWVNEEWRENPHVALVFTECCICLDDITDTPVNDLLGLQCCQHVFHGTCILNWVWKNYA